MGSDKIDKKKKISDEGWSVGREIKQVNVTGTLDWWRGRSWKGSEKVTFNLSLDDEKQPAFQRLGKECSSQKCKGPTAVMS